MRRSKAPSKFKPPTRVVAGGAVSRAGTGASAGSTIIGSTVAGASRQPLVDDDVNMDGDSGGIGETPSKVPFAVVTNVRAGSTSSAATIPRKTFLQPPPSKRSKQGPLSVKGFTPHKKVATSAQPSAGSTAPQSLYFKVMYRKSSRKIHKAWEGDGFLECRGPIACMKDEEGKDIGRGRIKGAADLEVGSEFNLGGKEVEVSDLMSEGEWSSGRCFIIATSAAPSHSSTTTLLKHGGGLPKGPMRLYTADGGGIAAVSKPKVALFSADDPGAVVLSRPGPHTGSVAVVVDPFLAHTLRPHQVEGVQFLYAAVMGHRSRDAGVEMGLCGAILADEMGLGKTIQCITLMWTLLRQGPEAKPIAKRVLIVTPASLIKNWKAEIKKWLGDERLKTYAVDKDLTPEAFTKYSSQVAPVLIISYESVVRHADHIRAVKFDLIICDEAHRMKNAKMKTNTVLSSLNCTRRVCLTGTPVQNDLKEFFAIADFAASGALGSAALFTKVYEEPIVRARQPGASAKDTALGEARSLELSSLIQSFFLRRTNEINARYLPPKHEYVVFVRPTAAQARVYETLSKSKVVTSCLAGSSGSGAAYLVAINALRKAANCPLLLSASASKEDAEGPKSEWADVTVSDDLGAKLSVLQSLLIDVAARTEERVVVVSNSTKCLDVISSMCTRSGFKVARLDGSTPTATRMKIVDTFNSGVLDQFVFLLSTKAGGVGLNIVGASRLVLFDIDWNPAHDLQAMARVWRDGQTRPVHIYRLLLAGTIDEKIFQRQLMKQGLSTAIDVSVGTAGVGASEFSWQELRDLFAFHEGTACKTLDLIQQHKAKATSLGGDSAVTAPTFVQLMEWDHHAMPVPDLPDGTLHRIQGESESAISFIFHREGNGASSASPPVKAEAAHADPP